MRRTFSFFIATAVLAVFLLPTIVVSAQSEEDLLRIYQDAVYYDPTSSSCNASGGSSSGGAKGENIFVIGDSLTVGMRDAGGLQEKLEARGWTVMGIEATTGININDTLPILDTEENHNAIQSSDTILIGLGTNKEGNFGAKITELYNKLKSSSFSPSATIYWINTYSPDAALGYDSVNAEIAAQAAALPFNVIDWAKEASDNPTPYPFASDNLHHTGNGYDARAAFIASSLGNISSGSTSGSAVAIPERGTIGLVGADNQEKIWNFFIAAGLSPVQAAGVMGNIEQESGYNPAADQGGPGGTSGAYGNAFGIVQWDGGRRTALENAARDQGIDVSDLSFQLVYLYNESLGRQVKGSSSPDFPQPLDAPNEWEGLKRMTSIRDAVLYWEWNFERSADLSAGLQQRVDSGQAAFDKFNGTSGGVSGAGRCSSVTSGGSGVVNADGYSFPLEATRGMAITDLPCSARTCHHDGTPAADLSYEGIVGKKVYAISDGTIDKISEQDPGWCYSIQFKSSRDNLFYWYGHLNNVVVSEGATVKAGEVLAEVAEWVDETHECGGTSSGAHLHIDRGCIENGVPQRGGGVEGKPDKCRDADFIPFLNQLYEGLPA